MPTIPTVCFYCNHAIDSSSIVGDPSMHSHEDEMVYIQDRVRQMDSNLIAEPQKQRSAFLQRRNSIQSSTRMLLPEMLSIIFEYACLPTPINTMGDPQYPFEDWIEADGPKACPPDPYFHLALGQVCVYWRQVVMSTPQLWASFRMKVNSETARGFVVGFRQFLRNSGSVPLSLALSFSMGNVARSDVSMMPLNTLVDEQVDDILFENLGRIKELYLSLPPPRWIPRVFQCPQLTDLFFDFPTYPVREREASREVDVTLPNLRRLHLQHVDPRFKLRLRAPVTSLSMYAIPMYTCADVLSGCLGLTKFRINFRMDYHLEYDWSLHTPLILDKMVEFEWDATDGPWHNQVIDRIRLPNLRVLRWSVRCCSSPQDPPTGVINFFRRLPSALSTLELDYFQNYSSAIPLSDFFPDLSIESLSLTRCTGVYMQTVLQELTITPGKRRLFPGLKTLTLGGRSLDPRFEQDLIDVYSSDFSHAFLDMLKGRLEGNDFRLEFASGSVDWLPSVQEELRQMVQDGCKLDIIVNGESVQWLRPS